TGQVGAGQAGQSVGQPAGQPVGRPGLAGRSGGPEPTTHRPAASTAAVIASAVADTGLPSTSTPGVAVIPASLARSGTWRVQRRDVPSRRQEPKLSAGRPTLVPISTSSWSDRPGPPSSGCRSNSARAYSRNLPPCAAQPDAADDRDE